MPPDTVPEGPQRANSGEAIAAAVARPASRRRAIPDATDAGTIAYRRLSALGLGYNQRVRDAIDLRSALVQSRQRHRTGRVSGSFVALLRGCLL
jgi:hypothetical protein